MTNREFLTAISNGTMNDEVIAHAQEKLQILEAQSAERSGKTDKENEVHGMVILKGMETGKKYTARELTEVAIAQPEYTGTVGRPTTSKITSIMKTMAKLGKVEISEIRVGNTLKKAYEVIQ